MKILAMVSFLVFSLSGSGNLFAETKKDNVKSEKKVLIKMWTSRNGGQSQENVINEIDIAGLFFDGLNAYDIQYEKTLMYKGIRLRDLISQYKPVPNGFEFVMLHSRDGMIIPVDIGGLRKDSEVFVALAVQDEKTKKWSTDFAPSVYSQENKEGQITLKFTGNKMVVGKNWRHTDFAITPWRFFDTLAGIEFVSSSDYYKFLEPEKGSAEIGGRSVYMRRCQYCHGLGSFGATFAPNFAQLFPDDESAAIEKIMNKVLPSSKVKNSAMNFRMPKQGDFTKAEAKDLVNWLKTKKVK